MRQGLRINGVVRAAQRLRGELRAPLSSQRREVLRAVIVRTLQAVSDILREHGASEAALPAPTRRALAYLRNIDLDAAPRTVVVGSSSEDAPHKAERPARAPTWRVAGLSSRFEACVRALGDARSTVQPQRVFERIEGEHRHLERLIEHHADKSGAISPEHLALRGWFAFFSRREEFDGYRRAVAAARGPMTSAMRRQRRFRGDLVVHFRPMRGIFRLRQSGAEEVTLRLPTAMVRFDPALFEAVAVLALGAGERDGRVLAAMQSPAYREALAEFEALSGVRPAEQGAAHDLSASFARVNEAYFGGRMARPRLRWSDRLTSCKFGHYDFTIDEIQLSATLDAPNVPEFVIDAVMYHELLHKEHGLTWAGGRGFAHTPEFRRDERRFARHDEADRFLNDLARWRA
ncbi:MAG: hypothetical protein FLDDKLPJ_00816 [Phycisphaerae bacterium]|nr:hypothetical protein [Phycisphaerae bacterium]